jgi:hypothetical protein
MDRLRANQRPIRRPLVEFLEDRRPVSDSLRPLAAVAAVTAAAYVACAPPSFPRLRILT